MSTEWFRKWFDSKYYHLLYHYRDENEAELFIHKLADFLDLPKKSRILDIACGKGRHALILSELNYAVTGIDLSENSISEAKKLESKQLSFHCHDKRKVFKTRGFDCGLNLFTSFGYLEDREALEDAFQNMTANIVTGGLFVLDYFNSVVLSQTEHEHENVVIQDVEFEIEKFIESTRIVKSILVKDGERQMKFKESVQLFAIQDFRNMFEYSGFEILHTFGNYNLENYYPETSERLIIIAKRIE